jgi:hypothetical protein
MQYSSHQKTAEVTYERLIILSPTVLEWQVQYITTSRKQKSIGIVIFLKFSLLKIHYLAHKQLSKKLGQKLEKFTEL